MLFVLVPKGVDGEFKTSGEDVGMGVVAMVVVYGSNGWETEG